MAFGSFFKKIAKGIKTGFQKVGKFVKDKAIPFVKDKVLPTVQKIVPIVGNLGRSLGGKYGAALEAGSDLAGRYANKAGEYIDKAEKLIPFSKLTYK